MEAVTGSGNYLEPLQHHEGLNLHPTVHHQRDQLCTPHLNVPTQSNYGALSGFSQSVLSQQGYCAPSQQHGLHLQCFSEMAQHDWLQNFKGLRCPICRSSVVLSAITPYDFKASENKVDTLKAFRLAVAQYIVKKLRPVVRNPELFTETRSYLIWSGRLHQHRANASSLRLGPALSEHAISSESIINQGNEDNRFRRRLAVAFLLLGVFNLTIKETGGCGFVLCLCAAGITAFARKQSSNTALRDQHIRQDMHRFLGVQLPEYTCIANDSIANNIDLELGTQTQ